MKWFGAFIGLILLFGAGSAKGEKTRYPLFDLRRGTPTTLREAIPHIMGCRIVLVGERHTEMSHHRAQLAVIQRLHEGGASVTVGLEMFPAADQAVLDQWIAGQISGDDFRKAYDENWSFPWDLYGAIFDYAKEMTIPMVGLNLPRDITRQVSRRGFQSLSPDQRKQLPDTVVCDVDDEYMSFIRRAHGAHAHGRMNFIYFCEAQLVWDQAMAIAALRYLDDNPVSSVVILAGTGHVWKPGIPEQIRQRSSHPQAVLLPLIPGSIEPAITTLEDADYIIDTRASEP